ncbi:tRNA threonylcarbamoyladenosine biosynthesis protein TsaB [hydrothermal vent metagenome]|uniref:tRNA threonylcarbamoyladenosine biosynthesis protein TsaB n=1 Tax=hydrothermal vent metagenome TaxID=652676 RepID=A0A3B1A0D2_9ZZZZ
MNILAFDTSTMACSVALSIQSQAEILSEHIIQPRGHANLILGMIETLLNQAHTSLSDVDAIAFGQGPGSFTGLRIAAGVCQGIAYSHDIPVIALSSLAVLAQGVYRDTKQHNIAVLQDARMSEIYWGCYSQENGIMKLVGQENVSSPDMLCLDNSISWYSVGEALTAYENDLKYITEKNCNKKYIYPNAIDMISLAETEFKNKNFTNATDVNPIYLRNNVASKKN